MIHEFHVQNYKALRDVKLKLTPMHVLIGPNDSGKTSILEALGALCRSVEMPLGEAFQGRWDGHELITHGSNPPVIRFEAKITLDPAALSDCGYILGIAFAPHGRNAHLAYETASIGNHCVLSSNDKQPSPTTRVNHLCTRRIEPGDQAHDAAVALQSSLRNVQEYQLNPSQLAMPVVSNPNRRFRLEKDGFGLAQLLDEIKDHSAREFVKLDDRFAKFFDLADEISLERSRAINAMPGPGLARLTYGEGEGKGICFRSRRTGVKVSASQVSDGMLLVLAYLALLYSPEPPRLLLIEEPENGIHPERLKEVIGILRELVAENGTTQVIMTTHSPYMVDLFKPEEITLCYKDDAGDVKTRSFADSPIVRQQMGFFTMGEIWRGEEDVIQTEATSTETVSEVQP